MGVYPEIFDSGMLNRVRRFMDCRKKAGVYRNLEEYMGGIDVSFL